MSREEYFDDFPIDEETENRISYELDSRYTEELARPYTKTEPIYQTQPPEISDIKYGKDGGPSR